MSDELHNPDLVAKIIHCPRSAVTKNLEVIYSALNRRGMLTTDIAIGVLGTIAIETASTFEPVAEAYWLGQAARWLYYDKTAYAKVDPVTHQRYYGRGFVQRTWKSGYSASGQILKLPLLEHPDLLLQPNHAADDLALFFFQKPGLQAACIRHDWRQVRHLVSGGYSEVLRLIDICQRLLAISV